MRIRLSVVTVGVVLAVACGSREARGQAAEAWVMVPFVSTGVDATAASTFVSILQSELVRSAGAFFIGAPRRPCPDGVCAVASARSTGARFVVWGELSALGSKVIVRAFMADALRNVILCSQRMSAARVEDLDTVAVEIARAIAARRSVDTVTEARPLHQPAPAPPAPQPAPQPPIDSPSARQTVLPPPPAQPVPALVVPEYPPVPPPRLDATLGLLGRLGGIVPLGKGYGGNPGGGVALDVGFWWEKGHLGVEPRVGVRFDAVANNSAKYTEVPMDVGVFFLFSTADVVPYAGAGFGVRYFWERRVEKVTLGQVLPASSEIFFEDSAWGSGLYVRAGLMLKPSPRGTTRTKLALTADYNVAFVNVNGFRNPTSMVFAGSLVF